MRAVNQDTLCMRREAVMLHMGTKSQRTVHAQQGYPIQEQREDTDVHGACRSHAGTDQDLLCAAT